MILGPSVFLTFNQIVNSGLVTGECQSWQLDCQRIASEHCQIVLIGDPVRSLFQFSLV